MRVLYLAHDLDDTAIWRRVEMLRRGGAEVFVAGFRRQSGGGPAEGFVLGQTQDGRLAARALQVIRTIPGLRRRLRRMAGAAGFDAIVARNLEMLILARSLRAHAPIIYELLDIHRVMVREDAIGTLMRSVERSLLRGVAQVWISSPGFTENYLAPRGQNPREILLVENKPLVSSEPAADGPRFEAIDPERITIGWLGILRCRWSLATLDALTRHRPGRYRVILRGRPSRDVLPDFDAVVSANPDLEFGGAYSGPADLADIYGQCDLAWLIDRFDAGHNSDWLLPNRLYEGSAHGAVPVVLAGTQVARYAASKDIGLHCATPDLASITRTLDAVDGSTLSQMRRRLASLPLTHWVAAQSDCNRLVDALHHAADNRFGTQASMGSSLS